MTWTPEVRTWTKLLEDEQLGFYRKGIQWSWWLAHLRRDEMTATFVRSQRNGFLSPLGSSSFGHGAEIFELGRICLLRLNAKRNLGCKTQWRGLHRHGSRFDSSLRPVGFGFHVLRERSQPGKSIHFKRFFLVFSFYNLCKRFSATFFSSIPPFVFLSNEEPDWAMNRS